MRFKVLGFLGVVMSFLCLLSIPTFAEYFGFYVLDGYGGVHAGGGAPAISPSTAYFGWDIARAIQYVPVGYTSTVYGEGYIVLDGYGGIHRGGSLASIGVSATPYFGWDIARDLTMRLIPPRANYYNYSHGFYNFTNSTSFSSICGPVNIYCPDDGVVILNATVLLQNLTAGMIPVYIAISMDGTSGPTESVYAFQDMQPSTTETITFSQGISVTAGRHEFYVVMMLASAGTIRYHNTNLTAIYVDQGSSGYSAEHITEGGGNSGSTGSIR